MSVPSIPTSYSFGGNAPFDIHTTLDGSLDTTSTATIVGDPNRPLSTLLIGDRNKPLTTLVIGDRNQPLTTLLIGDPNQPISTDSKIELLNLPRFTLQDIKDMMKVRVRMPNYSQVCFKLLGQELFSICLNGEAQVITEPYVPNAMERCETECCEADTRPFPERGNGDVKEFVVGQ